MKKNLITLTLATALLAAPALSNAAEFVVSKTADTNDGACDMDCSLREAIIASNSNGEDDTIILDAGTYVLSIPSTNEDLAADGDLDILATSSLTIQGKGPGLTIIDGKGVDRVFDIKQDTGDVLIEGLAITGGELDIVDEKNPASGANCIRALGDTEGLLTLRNLYIHDNGSAETAGDACVSLNEYALSPGVIIERSTISNNTSFISLLGGGVQATNSNVRIINSTISGNLARAGGGIGLTGTNAETPVTMEVFNSTIYDNTATLAGGGAASSGAADSSIIFSNTIISGNHVLDDNQNGIDCKPSIPSYFQSLGYNIVGNSADCEFPKTNSDQLDINVTLPPLADNGSNVPPTHAITEGSLALNAGNPDACNNGDQAGPETDERGEARIFGPACDVGAYESNIELGSSNLSLTKEADKQEVELGDTLTYTLTLVNNGPNKSLVTQVVDPLPPELEFVSASSSDNTDVCNHDANTNTVTCDLGTVNVLEPVTITIVTTVVAIPADNSIDNTATSSSSETDPDETDNSSSATTVANGEPGPGPFNGSLSGGADIARIIGCALNPAATGFDFSAVSYLGMALAGLATLRIRRK